MFVGAPFCDPMTSPCHTVNAVLHLSAYIQHSFHKLLPEKLQRGRVWETRPTCRRREEGVLARSQELTRWHTKTTLLAREATVPLCTDWFSGILGKKHSTSPLCEVSSGVGLEPVTVVTISHNCTEVLTQQMYLTIYHVQYIHRPEHNVSTTPGWIAQTLCADIRWSKGSIVTSWSAGRNTRRAGK